MYLLILRSFSKSLFKIIFNLIRDWKFVIILWLVCIIYRNYSIDFIENLIWLHLSAFVNILKTKILILIKHCFFVILFISLPVISQIPYFLRLINSEYFQASEILKIIKMMRKRMCAICRRNNLNSRKVRKYYLRIKARASQKHQTELCPRFLYAAV